MSSYLPFVELEFAHAIGPAPGRYVLATGEQDDVAGDVLQIAVHGAPPPRHGLLLRRARALREGDAAPRELSVLRVTWIGASQATSDEREARDRLERLRHYEDEREELVTAVLDVVNVAVRAHRAAARDPYAPELARSDPREVVLGYGTAEELAQGGWSQAFRAPPQRAPKLDRAQRLAPSEAVALALAGDLDLLAADELCLRALLDLEQDRPLAAAHQLRAAADLLTAELATAEDPEGRMAAFAPAVAAAREEAVRLAADGAPDPAELDRVLGDLERVLFEWRAPASQEVGAG